MSRTLATASPSSSATTAGLAVDVRSVSKHYAGVLALDRVSLTIAAGEIHALVGENGAGKSTLGKMIAGAIAPDEGQILVNEEPVHYRSPRSAIRAGITLLSQELALVPAMSILDNVFLGVEPETHQRVDRRAQRRRYADLAKRVGLAVHPMVTVGALSVADQQKVELLRALARDARLIVMDEPTAALSRTEAQRLLAIAREVRDTGATIIFVSHFLDDVLAISDRVTVLKDGRHVRTAAAQDETVESLVTAMLGRPLDLVFPEKVPPGDDAPVMLSVRNLSRAPAFHDVSLDVRAGEIVGLAGLVGSGRTEIARAIFGADRSSGSVSLEGRPLRNTRPRNAIKNGVALLPESRKEQGLVMIRSVSENLSLVYLDAVSPWWLLRRSRERSVVTSLLQRVDARLASSSMPVSALSGGNQQKVALAKWLMKTPRVLIADEPTRGIDVGAKRAIYELIAGLAAAGTAVVLISSEIEEVIGLAHRVLVVRDGSIVAEFAGQLADEEAIMRAAFGKNEDS